LLGPYGIFVDEKGLLYISDPGAYRITIIDPKDGSVRNITAAGGEDFLSPIGVVVFRDRIFVSDSRLRKVFILDSSGKLTGTFEGNFGRPTALALDAGRGVVYVTDTLAHRVYQYTPEGKRLGSIGKNGSEKGEFNFPTHLWVDRIGRLFVTDSLNFRVQIFSPDGSWEGMFGMLGDAYGDLEKPKGVATDSEGNIYVVDSIKDMIKIFDRQGALLLFFGSQGRAYGEFWLPSGIFIDNNDYIYITDTYNGRVQVFKYLGKRKDRVAQ
jgi:DNA-binding beta-propeller fold protein YncE